MGPPRITHLVPVPTGALTPMVADTRGVKGYEPAELQAAMRQVPSMYAALASGRSVTELTSLESAPAANDQLLGRTTRHLLATSPMSRPLRAELDSGTLTITDGNHRIVAARQVGVPFVPVLVSANSRAELADALAGYHRQLGREYLTAVGAHERFERERRTPTRPSQRPSSGRDGAGRALRTNPRTRER
jgi:hypothetical protein